jgi:integrase
MTDLIPIEVIKEQLHNRYRTSGYAENLFRNDWSILMRLGVHPALATIPDLERVILRAKTQSTRANYASRLKSMFKALNKMRLIDTDPTADLPPIKRGRGVPKPITPAEFFRLLEGASEPFRSWFILGGYAGLRAMEVANLRGADLEEGEGGFTLRVLGKGGTDLLIPVAGIVAETIQKHQTLDRLWNITPNKLSSKAADEMRRILGANAKHFHSLRHYFATSMLEKSGGDLMAVKELMRHTTVATTQIYTQLAQGRTRTLVNLIE